MFPYRTSEPVNAGNLGQAKSGYAAARPTDQELRVQRSLSVYRCLRKSGLGSPASAKIL